MKKKNKYIKELQTIEINLDLYLSSMFDDSKKKKEKPVYFASYEDYMRAEKGLPIETTAEKFQKQFKLTLEDLQQFQQRVINIRDANRTLIKEFNKDQCLELRKLIFALYDFNAQFYKESQGQDYLYGMENCLTRIIHVLQCFPK